jgi:hypothetical protein
LISLDSTMIGKLSMNLIPAIMLRNILKNMTSYFPDGYSLYVRLQQNNINLFYDFLMYCSPCILVICNLVFQRDAQFLY